MTEVISEFVVRGRREIRFVAIAIGNEMDRLMAFIEETQDEDEQAYALKAIGLYREILIDMGDPR